MNEKMWKLLLQRDVKRMQESEKRFQSQVN